MRTQDITSDVFVCPSTGLTHFDYGGGKNNAMNWSNWPGKASLADHLSYSMNNPYVSKDAIAKGFKWNNTLGAEFAIAADMNPGVDALTTVNVNSPADQMRKVNSRRIMAPTGKTCCTVTGTSRSSRTHSSASTGTTSTRLARAVRMSKKRAATGSSARRSGRTIRCCCRRRKISA